jgi:hypothetical protein
VVSSDDRKYIPLLISGVWQSQRVPFTYRLASTKFQAEKWFTLGEVESAASRQFCTPNALLFPSHFRLSENQPVAWFGSHGNPEPL